MHFVNENLFVLLVIGFGCLVIGFARFCHWQEKRESVQDRDYYERHWQQWHPRT